MADLNLPQNRYCSMARNCTFLHKTGGSANRNWEKPLKPAEFQVYEKSPKLCEKQTKQRCENRDRKFTIFYKKTAYLRIVYCQFLSRKGYPANYYCYSENPEKGSVVLLEGCLGIRWIMLV